jgi:PPOX class probable F420-dependent enzyme
LPDWAHELASTARVGRLGLLDERERPRVLPITFVLVGDSVWSAVDRKPKRVAAGDLARVRWLRTRPWATLLIDRYSDDWDQLAWLQLIGQVTVVDGAQPPEELIDRYPQYRRDPPTGPLLRLDVMRAVHWRAAGSDGSSAADALEG